MVGFFDLVGTGIAPVSKKHAVKVQLFRIYWIILQIQIYQFGNSKMRDGKSK